MKTQKYVLDKVSGIEGSVFGLSVIPEVWLAHDRRHEFKVPNYALSIFVKTNRSDEWIDEDAFRTVSHEILAQIERQGMGYFEKARSEMNKETKTFEIKVRRMLPTLSTFTNEELIGSFKEFIRDYTYHYGLGATTFIYESILSDELYKSLAKRYPNVSLMLHNVLENEYESFMVQSERLLTKIKNEKDKQAKRKLVAEYQAKFFYIKTNYADAQTLNFAAILKLAESAKIKKRKACNSKKISAELTRREEASVNLLKLTASIHDDRKRLNLIGSYALFRFLDEAAVRTKADRNLLKRMFWTEFEELLATPEKLTARLRRREIATCAVINHRAYYLEYNAVRPRQKCDGETREFKGTPPRRAERQMVQFASSAGQAILKNLVKGIYW